MNKLIILLLVVCLVSVQAFVKRDAPDAKDFVDNAKNFLESSIKEIADKINPDAIKKTFGDAVDNINKAFSDLKVTEAPKAA